jgi:cytochrome c-type protein NapC
VSERTPASAPDEKKGALARGWSALRRPSARYSVVALLVVGFIAGIIFWGGFNTAMEATNSIAFCTGCHEMHDNVYQEYQGSIHDINRTGVRAICSDCHVPKDWVHKVARKIQASNEVYHWLAGTVNTKEKFEAHRMELATHVWKVMKDSNSRECRNCHSFEAMKSSKQSPRAQKNHAEARAAGKTCIDCHKGIAHLLPREYNEDEE